MSIQLLQGDCLQVMQNLPAQSVEAIITDLPYGTTDCSWDEVIPFEPMWEQVKRILKPRGVFVTTASQPFTSKLVMSNPEWFRYEWVWEKSSSTGFFDANHRPLKSHENILVFADGLTTYHPQKIKGEPNHARNARTEPDKFATYHGESKRIPSDVSGMKFPRSVIKFSKHPETEDLHPNQKPVSLYEYLILTYTNPGDTVLDMCAGSGTTGEAAIKTGRGCILIEKKPEYFGIIQNRMAQVEAQPLLFGA
jgi:site-specific DNA-methyltransferase (adenine-specific)